MVIKYNIISRLLHGLIGLVIIFALCMGIWMTSEPKKFEYYGIHKSVGIVILLLVFIRISVRAVTESPRSFYKLGSINSIAEKFTYFAFYILMFSIPLTGYLMSNAGGYDVFCFGIKMPLITNKNIEFAEICHLLHEYASYSLLALIVLHIINISYRILIKKHNILERMI